MKNATTTSNTFENVKRNFENAHASGADYSKELTDLAKAVAYSVLKKCLDPQRKTAVDREEVSNNGQNPTLQAVKNGIRKDYETLAGTEYTASRASRATLNADGDPITETVDKAAQKALDKIIRETLSDGIDLVQGAALAILEQAAEHAAPGAWLDKPYTVRRLARRVYIRREDSAAYRNDTTTPIQEVYRAVRREVQNSRAMQTDPRNGYSYIEDIAPGGLDVIFYRTGKYTDLGDVDSAGNYTTSRRALADYDAIMEKLNLTPRQAKVLELRMQGRGKKAIGTYLGIDPNNVGRTLRQIQAKAKEIGLTPA